MAKEEFKVQLTRKETENIRLRDQREQQTSEMNERKHKESVKIASLNEMRSLAESRSVSVGEVILVGSRLMFVCDTTGSNNCVGVGTQETQGATRCQHRQRRSIDILPRK